MKNHVFLISILLSVLMSSIALGQLSQQDYTKLKNIVFQKPEIVDQPKLAFVIEQNNFEDEVYFMLNYKDKREKLIDESERLTNSFNTWLEDQLNDQKDSPLYKEVTMLQDEYNDLSNQINGAERNKNNAMSSYRLCMAIFGNSTCNGHIQNARKHESRQKQLVTRINNMVERLNAAQNKLARSSGLTDAYIDIRRRRSIDKNEVLVKEVNEMADTQSAHITAIFDNYMNAEESFLQFQKDQKLKKEQTEKATTKSSALDILKKAQDN